MGAPLFPEVVVNGETVPHAEIAAEAQHHSAPRGKPGLAWYKAARALAIRTLLLQEARRRGMATTPRQFGEGRTEDDSEALVRELLEAEVRVTQPSDAAVHDEWARDPSRFRSPPLWEASHILIACDARDLAAADRAKSQALQILERLQNRANEFGLIASDQSACDTRSAGGFLGQIRPGDMLPEIETALRQLKAGEICSEPVLTVHGYHILRLDAVAESYELPFGAVRDRIAEALEKAAWTKAAVALVGELVAKAQVSGVDVAALRKVSPQ